MANTPKHPLSPPHNQPKDEEEILNEEFIKDALCKLTTYEKIQLGKVGRDLNVTVTIEKDEIRIKGQREHLTKVIRSIFTLLNGVLQKKTGHKELAQPTVEGIPPTWKASSSSDDMLEVLLSPSSAEYKEVEESFHRDFQETVMSDHLSKVIQIVRVQNWRIYQQYLVEKKDVEKGLRPGIPAERSLWHGTIADITTSINRNGFNRSYHGKNAAMFGKGTYFSSKSSYAAQDQYSRPDMYGNKLVYRAKVVTGEYTKGHQNYITPPPKNPADPSILYDSVVDNEANPKIFVIFKDTKAYPEYIIKFH